MEITIKELREAIRRVLNETPTGSGYEAWAVVTKNAEGEWVYKTNDRDTGKAKRIGNEAEGSGPGYWTSNIKRAKIYTNQKVAMAGAQAEMRNGIKANIKRIF